MNKDLRFFQELYALASNGKMNLNLFKMEEASKYFRQKLRHTQILETNEALKMAYFEDLLDELIWLTNRFSKLRKLPEHEVPETKEEGQLITIIKELEGLIFYMEHEAPSLFNYKKIITASMLLETKSLYESAAMGMIKTLKTLEIEESLIKVAVAPIQKFANDKNVPTTLEHLFYLKMYYSAIMNFKLYEKQIFTPKETFLQLLISLNLNSQFFINYLSAFLRSELENLPSNEQRIKHLLYRRDILSVIVIKTKFKYRQDRRQIMVVIKKHLMLKIAYYKTCIELEKYNHEVIREITPVLHTSLTVPTLALFCRLLLNVKIIEAVNDIDLFRAMASIVKTKNTGNISPLSLKNKSTSFDEKTLMEGEKIVDSFRDEFTKIKYNQNYRQ